MNRRTLGTFRAALVWGALLLCAAAPAAASHFRGGNVYAQVSPAGVATLTYETLWRKGIAFFPFDGVGQIQIYNPSDTSRNSALRTVSVSIGNTTVFRDVSDPAFDFRRQVVMLNLAALGLSQGRYVARWENCCRISGIQNAPESSFSLETLLVYDGTANGSPVLNSRILTVVGKGLPYGQNLNAFDPDGRALTYQFLVGSGRPTFGPTVNVPGMTLDVGGQAAIPATATAVLVDVNRFNPAGDYVFKVRVTDADGVFSERDVLLDVVATANRPPEIAPIGNRVLGVGESLVLPISATDPNPVDRVTLRTSQLPANMAFVTTPGNPASGTIAFRPGASQVGTFGINVEASDNGSPVLTDSELLTLTVLDPNNNCPVLAPVGNRELVPGETLSFTLSAADPDPGQTLSFSASFLPPGASFDPATRTFTWTPTSGQTGVHLGAVFEVRDSASPPCPDREVVGFSVQPANRFPVLGPIGHLAVAEGSTIAFTVGGTDPDGDALELGAEPLPLGALFDPSDRLFQWRPALGQAGIYEITFRATDDGSPRLSDEETVRITVARAGEEAIRFAGLAEEQEVAGTILVEAQVTSPFPVVAVEFEIDGAAVNRDEAAPFFLGGEADGLPLGFDTAALQDGLHVLSATALDAAGQVTTAQRTFTTSNFVAPDLMGLTGIFDGGVVSGLIEVEAEAIDDQQVAAVSFAIDGTAVNTETSAPYFLAGSRLPAGTFDVSCRVCLRVGDRDGDLVVAALEEDGTIARLCGATAGGSAVSLRSHGSGTPDGVPPADEEICDALSGRAFGLCTAFCEAHDCDAPGHKESASCDQLRQNFARLTDEQRFPCEQLGGCIEHLTLAVADDPSLVATFDHEDFSGAMTTFELPFPVPVGFDTTSLADGPHTLTITLTDNQGLTTVVEVHFDVQNGALPPDALRVGLVEPAAGTYEAGRVLPVAAAVASAQGPVTVSFYANGRLLAADTEAPYQTALLLDGGSVTLHAVARDGRGPRQSPAVALAVLPRPAAPAPIEVLSAGPEDVLDDRAAGTTTLRIVFSREVAAASLAGGIRLARGEEEVPLDLRLEPDRVTVIATPTSPLAPDALHVLTVVGVAADDGALAPRFTARFLTFPDVAIVAGRLLDGAERPIPGIAVRVGTVAGVSDSEGLFRLVGVPTGAQILHVEGGTVAGLTYPPLELALEVRPGIVENGMPRPIYLPALDLGGGLDVVGGVATGSGILTSSALPGITLDLRGVTVLNGDGAPFTGRMSITPVPAPNVPMPPPVGVYSSSYVTIQPAVHLVPPAPITYPNLDGALPGEPIPLWHFDHGSFAWVHYGFGTVTGNGARIVSNPGQGLPETGWGSPQPPNTFTTVTGTVVDKEGSPLHGCRVVAGNVEGFSRNDGSFSLAQVPAGRQGSPVQIRVTVTAKDVEGMTYPGSSAPVTAVQNGTTDVGQVKIDSYGPLLEGKLKLHADFQDASRNHFLMVGSSHSAEMRYRREVEELQKRLMGHGFRQGGNNYDHGQPLVADGDYGDSTKKAVSLFQALELTANGANGSVSTCGICTGVFREKSLAALNKIPPERQLWENAGPLAGLDYPCNTADPTGATPLIANGWGTFDMGSFLLFDLPVVPSDDISLPAGGPYRPHGSHQTGIDVDIPLPRRDNGGCPGTPGWGQISLNNASQRDNIYDRVAMRFILQGIADSGHATLVLLGDRVLCVDEGLCTLETRVHHNHLHVRINLSAIDGGALASTPLTAKPAPGLIASLLAPGAGNADVPADAALTATFSQTFDPESLNASTVRLAGPEGEVQGDVVADPSGLAVRFKPALPLSFAVPYTFTVTTGAVLADGSLLAQPAVHAFTTEAAPSLRVAGSDPDDGVEVAPLDVAPAIRFDGPVDPRSLTPGAVTFSNVETGAVVPVELSLTEGQTLLTVRPAAPLAEVTTYGLELAGSIRGADGSPLARAGSLGAFSTSLAPGLERVEVTPTEVTITRADLSDLRFGVTGVYGDGTRRDLSDPQTSGTFYVVDGAAVDVAGDGAIVPAANGEAIVDVHPLLPGFDTPVRVRVAGVFPEVTFVGRRFDLRADEDVVLAFSERVDTAGVAVDPSSVTVADELGNGVAGAAFLSGDGLTLTFDPAGPLPLRRDYTIRFDLALTDGNGLTRVFPRRLRFATAAENLGFELGDFTGFQVEGDVEVVSSFGPLAAPEGDFMARLITSDTAVGGRTSVLRTVDLDVPEGATHLVFTYNFLTDEIEQGSPFNDFFRATLVLPDGTSTTILTVTRDQIRFSGSVSPVPGFDRMTGFRVGSVAVQAGTGPCHLVFEAQVSDAGDASIDSAVLIDDIHFQ